MKFDRKKFKPVSRGFARMGFQFSVWVFKVCPPFLVYSVVRGLINFSFLFLGRHKKIAMESLRVAFGKEKTEGELQAILKQCLCTFREDTIQLLDALARPEKINDFFVIEGKEHLDAALARGKGVEVITAHYGNFPLMMLALVKAGYPTTCVMKRLRDEKVTEYLEKKRDEIGLKTIYTHPRTACVGQSLKTLRNNELLFVLADQNFGAKGGVFVEFFGEKAATATGPVVFAQRTGAAILPMFIIRQPDGKQKIVIESEIKLIDHPDETTMFEINMGKITNVIEQYIRRYPYEWAWMHRRWKSRPQEENESESTNSL